MGICVSKIWYRKSMKNRYQRKEVAKETLDIIEKGFFESRVLRYPHDSLGILRYPHGYYVSEKVSIELDIENCDRNTKVLDINDWERLFEKYDGPLQWMGRNTKYEVTLEYSISCCQRLHNEGYKSITCLNFASAMSPFGGVLYGGTSQEETLILCSALFSSLSKQQKHYLGNRRDPKNGLYQDSLIFSPKCPVFRDDVTYSLFKPYQPFNVNFISCPAVNSAVTKAPKILIKETMKRRSKAILSVALDEGCDVLVLGAWGTGVFQNDIKDVAEYFKGVLRPDAEYEHSFEEWVDAFAAMYHNQCLPKIVFAMGTDLEKHDAFKVAFFSDTSSICDQGLKLEKQLIF